MVVSGLLLLGLAFLTAWSPPGTFVRDVAGPGALAMILIVGVAGSASLIGSPPALILAAILGVVLVGMGVFAELNGASLGAFIAVFPGAVVLVGAALMSVATRNKPVETERPRGPENWSS
jgi:hypothetical protein